MALIKQKKHMCICRTWHLSPCWTILYHLSPSKAWTQTMHWYVPRRPKTEDFIRISTAHVHTVFKPKLASSFGVLQFYFLSVSEICAHKTAVILVLSFLCKSSVFLCRCIDSKYCFVHFLFLFKIIAVMANPSENCFVFSTLKK